MARWVEGTVVGKRRWTDELYSLQVEAPVEDFQAGQFTKLALDIEGERVGRPYSYVNAPDERPLEFYFINVPAGPLTDRLVEMERGDTLWVSPRASGFFTLSEVPDADKLWLLSTGTALGVFLSILKTEEPWRRFGQVILVHAVRAADELTYQGDITAFAERHGEQFTFIPFVSREATDFALEGRIPQAIEDGRLERRAGETLTPEDSQVMICGNPEMVKETARVLEHQRGMRKNRRREPGHVTVEKYW